MAPRSSTRGAQRISYRESDQEDEADDSFDTSESDSPPPTRQAAKRKHPIQSGSHGTSRSRRGKAKVGSYAEDISDEEEDESDSSSDDQGEKLNGTRRSARRPVAKRPKLFQERPNKSRSSPQKAPAHRPARQAERPVRAPRTEMIVPSTAKAEVLVRSDNRIPHWTTLPYEIILNIMAFASHPLFDEHNNPSPSIAWLANTSMVCKAFLEPTLAALYRSPPLLNAVKPHRFLACLSQPDTTPTINYKVKVKCLKLEVRSTLAYSAGTAYPSLDLGLLVKQLPQLAEIDIRSVYDTLRHRHLWKTAKQWSYPETLFTALQEGQNKLKSFHWNGRLVGKMAEEPTKLYHWIHGIHLTSPFQSIRHLTLTSFLGDSDAKIALFELPLTPVKPLSASQILKREVREAKREAARKEDELLAAAISTLPKLTSLEMDQCAIVDGDWLSLLPNNLTSLSITECGRITSVGLQSFMETSGSQLRQLTLNHNPALSISFLTSMKKDCPRLEHFAMDFTYPSGHGASGSRDPEYDSLLLPDERPTWPSTLQSIKMDHLRQWTHTAAESFFGSLIDSAEDLPDLRHLSLTVSLSISWRDRAKFRDQWIDKLERVYLRKITPPNPHMMSFRMYREWQEKQSKRTLQHVEVPTSATNDVAVIDYEGDVHPTTQPSDNGKRRLRPRKASSDEEQLDPNGGPTASLHAMVIEALEKYVQGKCETVEIRIDNLRPTENQWHEDDFLDSEVSGDDDWDESNGDPDLEVMYTSRKGKLKKNDYAW